MMKPSTIDNAEGKFHEMKGKVKEKAGQLTNNRDLEAEGNVEKAAGKVQGIIGQSGESPRKIAMPASSPTVLNGNIGHSGQ